MNNETTYEVGEQVIYSTTGLGGGDRLLTVTHKTPTGRLTLSNGIKFDRHGREMNVSGYHRGRISKATPKEIAALQEQNRRAKALEAIHRSIKWATLDTDTLVRIVDIALGHE